MNFHSGREDAKKHASPISCSYCGKVFGNHGALGSHMRIHRDNRTLGDLNFPLRSHYVDINRNPPLSVPSSQQNLAGASIPIPIIREPHSIDFSTMCLSNDPNWTNRSISTYSGLGVAQTLLLMSPSGETSCRNNSYLTTFAPAHAGAAMPSAAFTSSGSAVTTGPPTVLSSYLGENNQGYNLGPPFSSAGRVGQLERSLSIDEGSKRPYMANNLDIGGMMNASKKPKVDVNFVEDSPSSSETCVGAKEEGPADLDLSLHL